MSDAELWGENWSPQKDDFKESDMKMFMADNEEISYQHIDISSVDEEKVDIFKDSNKAKKIFSQQLSCDYDAFEIFDNASGNLIDLSRYARDTQNTFWVPALDEPHFIPIRTRLQLERYMAAKISRNVGGDDFMQAMPGRKKLSKIWRMMSLDPLGDKNFGKFDNNGRFLPLRNGILEVTDAGEIIKHGYDGSEFWFQYTVKADIADTVESESWEMFLKYSLLDGKNPKKQNSDVDRFFEAMGYLLFGDRSAKALILLYGIGNDGKSLLCEFLEKIYTPVGAAVPTTVATAFSVHGAAYYHKARLLILGECNAKFTQAQVDGIKRLTGHDGVPLNLKHGAISEAHLDVKIIGACNHVPRFQPGSIDEALKQRILPIKMFTVPLEERRHDLLTALLRDADYFVKRAVEGFARLVRNKFVFTECKKDRLLKKQIFDANPAQQFLDDVCRIGEGLETPNVQLKKYFIEWKEREGADCSFREFKSALENLGFQQGRFNHGSGNNLRGFKGFKIDRP